MLYWYLSIVIGGVCCYPASWVQKIGESQQFNGDDNTLGEKFEDEFADLDKYFKGNFSSSDSKNENYTKTIIPFTTDFSDKNETVSNTTDTSVTSSQSPIPAATINLDPITQKNEKKTNETRNPRQEISSSEEQQSASQEEESSEEEEGGGNMLTGLLGAFLGGFSRPDGGIDIDAILGLLGTLSTQNPDGTYDFSGLSDLLQSFFGGGAGGGGSDIGAFVGGLLGALIKGVANPPGPKGAGILAGKVVTGVLPALSGPPPPMNDDGAGANNTNPWRKEPQLDSGSFLTGFLKTALGSGGNGMGQGGRGSKYSIFKLLFSAITGVLSAASSLSSKSDWN